MTVLLWIRKQETAENLRKILPSVTGNIKCKSKQRDEKGLNYEELWSQMDLVTAIAAEKQNIQFPTWQCSLGEQLGYLWPQNLLSGSC